MKFILTTQLLDFLISEGYRYCLSKSEIINQENARYGISLMPVKEKPVLSKFKLLFVASFDIREEPVEMTAGVENAKVWVILESHDIPKLKAHFLKVVSEKYSCSGRLIKKDAATTISHGKGMRKNLFS